MKKSIKLMVHFILFLLVFSAVQLVIVEALSTSTVSASMDTSSANILPRNPLSNSEIKSIWPKLPTAKALYDEGYCITVDLRYCGKEVASPLDLIVDLTKIDTKTPNVDALSWIVNCTTEEINWRDGGIIETANIWLQYNSSVWLLIPQKYLVAQSTKNH